MAKVLIVDDDKTLALDLSHTVSGWGYDVRVAETVSGALEAVKDWLPDVILCDLNLPDGSGMDIMKFVNLVNSEVLSVTFLFVSSEPATNVVTEALKLGADDYLIKPLDYDVLKARIHGLLSKQAKYEASLNSLSDETAARNGAFFAASFSLCFLVLGVGSLILVYWLKAVLGINVFSDVHLSDILSF